MLKACRIQHPAITVVKAGILVQVLGRTVKPAISALAITKAKAIVTSAWVNDTSKLLIGNVKNDADLDAMGVQKVTNIGEVIANASKNTDSSFTDHDKLNYSGELEVKDIYYKTLPSQPSILYVFPDKPPRK